MKIQIVFALFFALVTLTLAHYPRHGNFRIGGPSPGYVRPYHTDALPGETDETKYLSDAKLKRLIELENLKLIRLQQESFQSVPPPAPAPAPAPVPAPVPAPAPAPVPAEPAQDYDYPGQ